MVLRSFYNLDKDEAVKAIRNILKLSFIELQNREIIHNAFKLFETTNLDLEDCYNLYFAKSLNVDTIATFDIRLKKEFAKQ